MKKNESISVFIYDNCDLKYSEKFSSYEIINDIAKVLDYTSRQYITSNYIDEKGEIFILLMEIFTFKKIAVISYNNERTISNRIEQSITENFDPNFDFSPYQYFEIINSAILEKSFTFDYVSSIISLETSDNITFFSKEWELFFKFEDNILIECDFLNGQNVWAVNLKKSAPALYKEILYSAINLWGEIDAGVIQGVNIQAHCHALIPSKCYEENDFTKYLDELGHINYCLALIHFLDFKMPLIYFEIANAGKYITKYKGDIGAILILDSIEYFFGVDDLLISYEEK